MAKTPHVPHSIRPGSTAKLPLGATDSHVHVFDPARFPYAPDRRYTPPPARVEDLQRMHGELGIGRAVLVQPSVYKTDNRCLLEALARLGGQACGIAVVADDIGAQELADLWGAGVRGVRLNFKVDRHGDPAAADARLTRLAKALAPTRLLLQMHADLRTLLACQSTLRAAHIPVVLDHFGLVDASAGPGQDGFDELLDLLRCDHIWMKLSGPYQVSMMPGYADVPPIAKAFLQSCPERAVWGSDWPHTGGAHRASTGDPHAVEPFRVEDEQVNLHLVIDGLTPTQQRALLVDNPARLFGFPTAGRA